MIPLTTHSLDKLERLFRQLGFRLRYEKGNFKTGACILQDSKVIVVNRFLDLEAKIQAMIDVLASMPLDNNLLDQLDDKQRQLLLSIKQTKLEI